MSDELSLVENVNTKMIWVVLLDNCSRRKPIKDKKIVRARSEESAIRTAKANSIVFRNRKSHGSARLAHPLFDLGCLAKQDVLSENDSTKDLAAVYRQRKSLTNRILI